MTLFNCTDLTPQELKGLNLVRGVSGGICLLVSVIILSVLILAYKAYKNTLQRLILFSTVFTILYQFFSILQLEHQFQYEGQDTVCAILGGIYTYVANGTFMFAAIIINYLMYLVLRLCITGSLMTSKACGWTTEFIFVLFPLILPVVSMLQPLIYSNFGFGGFYCWVKSTNDLNFCRSDYTGAIIIYSLYEIICVEMLAASSIIFIVYCRIRVQLQTTDPMKKLVHKTCFLASFHAVSFAIITGIFSVFFYLMIEGVFIPNFATMFVIALLFPFFYVFGLIILFVISLRTSSILRPQKRTGQNNGNDSGYFQTNPSSHPFIQPSHTTFHPLHPDESLHHSNGHEKELLLSHTNIEDHNYNTMGNH